MEDDNNVQYTSNQEISETIPDRSGRCTVGNVSESEIHDKTEVSKNVHVKKDVQTSIEILQYAYSDLSLSEDGSDKETQESAIHATDIYIETHNETSKRATEVHHEGYIHGERLPVSEQTSSSGVKRKASFSSDSSDDVQIIKVIEPSQGRKDEQLQPTVPECSSSQHERTKNQKKQGQLDDRQPKKIKSKSNNGQSNKRRLTHMPPIILSKRSKSTMGGKSSSRSNIRLAIKPKPKAMASGDNERHCGGKGERNIKTTGVQSTLVLPMRKITLDTQQTKPTIEDECSDDEAIANISQATLEQATSSAATSFGAISSACSKIENIISERSSANSFAAGNDVQTIVNRFLHRGYTIPVRTDQKGSVFSILTATGYLEEKQLKDILETIWINRSYTYWYHHGQADDYCDHKFPHFHILHYSSSSWCDSAIKRRWSRFKQEMKGKDVDVRFETMTLKSPAGFMRYMLIGNKTLHEHMREEFLTESQRIHYEVCMEYYRDIEELPDNVKFQLLKNKLLEKVAKQGGAKNKDKNLTTLRWLLDNIRDTNAHDQASLFGKLQQRMSAEVVLISISCLRLNNQILQKFGSICMNMLLSLPQHLK